MAPDAGQFCMKPTAPPPQHCRTFPGDASSDHVRGNTQYAPGGTNAKKYTLLILTLFLIITTLWRSSRQIDLMGFSRQLSAQAVRALQGESHLR